MTNVNVVVAKAFTKDSPKLIVRNWCKKTPKTYKDKPMVLLTVTGISILDLL